MEELKLFSIPLYKFKYPSHTDFKAAIMPYLWDDEVWKGAGPSNSHVDFTTPNLHKMEMFNPIKMFIKQSLEEAMTDLGFEPNIQMTGMWGTRHKGNQYHHRHSHQNSFLAGVYYLSGTQENSGTIFYNVHRRHTHIVPAMKTQMKIRNDWVHPFEEGTLIIFPAWLEHSTHANNLNKTTSTRHILSFNSMPLGKTTNDVFDRFNFQDVSDVEMISRWNEVRRF